jgi:hypothetical protein
MPTTVIDEKTVECSIDAQFAYTDLKQNQDGKWETLKEDESGKLDTYKNVNKDNNIQVNILSHIKDSSSGFQATLIEKTDSSGSITKVIAIAGSNDILDFMEADYAILRGEVPLFQYKAMTNFVSGLIAENKISKADNITMVGTSLGGTLTQLGLPSFSDYIDNSYTFNSPGAANLELKENQASFWGWTSETYDYFNAFNENKESVGDKITNFTAASGLTFIADVGEDIGLEFRLPGSYHSIAEMQDGLQVLLETGYTTQEQVNLFTDQYKAIVEYYLPKEGLAFNISDTYLLKNPGVFNYLLQGIENDAGKAIDFDGAISIEFGEDNNLTININNASNNVEATEAINKLNEFVKIDQIDSII